MNEEERICHVPCGCRYDKATGVYTDLCSRHRRETITTFGAFQKRRTRKPLKAFRVYFAETVACVKIKAASKQEARTIAQDNYERGELAGDNAELRLLPEGRSIEAEFYGPGDNPPYISSVEEEEKA